MDHQTVGLEIWVGFNLIVVFLLLLDLFVFHRGAKKIKIKGALLASLLWVAIALLFNGVIYHFMGKETALNFLAGYLLEKSLSIDNLFVFLLIFKYFHIPLQYQYKVLFWGIFSAIVMRTIFIFFGISLVTTFHWVFPLFGIFLIYTGYTMAFPKSEEVHPENNLFIKALKKIMPITHKIEGEHFFVKESGLTMATPLFAALLCIESTDLIFALDSIPAVMGITLDPFIIYTSNIFAILGLRSLYFALSGAMDRFQNLHYGLAAILAFVGVKMILSEYIEVPISWTLAFIALAVTASLLIGRNTSNK